MTAGRAVDPRDIHATFGGITLQDDYVTIFKAPTENDLRRSLASVAHAYGWNVSEEVVIPGWGRIDLIVEACETYLIELKLDLTRPARIRRAFQQADGYGRWWTANRDRATDVFLVGAQIDHVAAGPVARSYPSVGLHTLGQVLNFFESGGSKFGRNVRRAQSSRRTKDADALGDAYRVARDRMVNAEWAEQALTPDGAA